MDQWSQSKVIDAEVVFFTMNP